MRTTTIIATIAALLLTTAVALSQDDQVKAPRPMAGPLLRLMKELNLTDEQKKEIEKIHFDAEKQAIATRSKIETAELELRQLIRADAPDKAALEKKIGEIAQLRTQAVQAKVNNWFTINKLLTPEQQKTWKKALAFGFAKHKAQMVRKHMARPGMRGRM